jgi:flagellar hook-length control protein FliK
MQPRAQAPQPLSPPAPSAPSQALATDLDLQFQDPNQPLAVQPGSVLTLKEDGTWSQPAPPQAAAPVSVAPQGVATADATPTTAVQGPVAPTPAFPQAPVTIQTVAAPSPAAGAPSTAPVQAPAPAAASSTVVPAVLTQAPVVAPVATQPGQQQPQDAAAPKPVNDGATASRPTLADAFQAPVQAAPARRNAADSSFGNLAQQPAQDPLKALAQQTARDYSVRESVFKQVYEALREAPDAESGRMLIRLKPAELGEVHVDLMLVNGKLSARLVASQSEVRDAFARDLPAFKAGLESQGVSVSEISVAVRAGADQQQQQPQQQQDAQAWWRQLPRQDNTPGLGMPASAGYTNLSVTDQRFSALA